MTRRLVLVAASLFVAVALSSAMVYAVIEGLRGQPPWLALGLIALPLGFIAMRAMFSLQTMRRPPWLGVVAVAVGAVAAAASSAVQVAFASFILGALLYFLGFAIPRVPTVFQRRPRQSL